MIYVHYDTMPDIFIDYDHTFEGEEKAVEQDNGKYSKRMIKALDELQAIDDARSLSRWFKTDSVFDVYRTGKQVKKPIMEVVK